MLETEFYCFNTSAYYRDCNPLLWFIILKDVVRPYHPSLRKEKHTDRNSLLAENQCPSLKPLWKTMAEIRIEFLGTASREAAIKVTDVISAPSSQCVNLAASFIKGYESKLEEKDKVLEIKIDGGFSESIGYYQMHEQFKTSFAECGYRIDKTYETFYKKCPKNSNYETSAEINDRLMETVKSIRTKYADSTSRTVAIFVDGTLQPALEFLITEPPTTLEIHILKALHVNKKIVKVDSQSWVLRWESTPMMWFILVEDDGFPVLRLREGKNEASERDFQSMTAVERKSCVMGQASQIEHFNISEVICAPSIKCIVAADSFINGFQCEKKDEIKGLNIKIDGGLSSTAECYYLHKEFRSLVVERGYDVDETYESSVERPTKCKEDPYVDLDSRLSAALKFMRRKYSDSEDKVVTVFVDKCLGSVLRSAARRSRMSENFEMFDSIVYCWDSVQLMCFVYVKDVDIPPRYVGKVGRQSQGSSGPIMTGIESSSVLMGAEIVEMPYNVTNVISAPNFKCLAAAAAFISGYQGPVKVGQNALNIKIDGGLSLTNAAFEMHEKFQSLVAESGYNIDKTYNLETRVEATLESLRKTFPGTWKDAVAIFVEKPLQIVLEIITINDPVPSEIYASAGKPDTDLNKHGEMQLRLF
ncbi:hypothetical protein T03_3908 [Trichinella britovi]|uniref:Uncharacterized protein n=1 Tax=Trichinella britovi TaxID=45882 RepID=A0A0V1CZ47_TRIBR|nr:hypothetical protein T03_3908 [Trichinella britovi]